MEQRHISTTGRVVLSGAVMMDRDWALTFSAVDTLIEIVSSLSDDDLEAARLLAGHLEEAVTCALIRRDTQKIERPAIT